MAHDEAASPPQAAGNPSHVNVMQPDGGGDTATRPPGSAAVPPARKLCDPAQPDRGGGTATRPASSVAVPLGVELYEFMHSFAFVGATLPRSIPKDRRPS